MRSDGVRAVVDDERVVAVDLEPLEPEHEPLQDGLGLEGGHAVQVALVVGDDDGAIYRPGKGGEEAALVGRAGAELQDGDCKGKSRVFQ